MILWSQNQNPSVHKGTEPVTTGSPDKDQHALVTDLSYCNEPDSWVLAPVHGYTAVHPAPLFKGMFTPNVNLAKYASSSHVNPLQVDTFQMWIFTWCEGAGQSSRDWLTSWLQTPLLKQVSSSPYWACLCRIWWIQRRKHCKCCSYLYIK